MIPLHVYAYLDLDRERESMDLGPIMSSRVSRFILFVSASLSTFFW